MKLTPGKLTGMKNVSNERGVIAAAAMDQRGSLKKALGTNATEKQLEDFKSLVTEVLTPHASAILLDPEWGLPASKRRAKNAGLLLAYEHSIVSPRDLRRLNAAFFTMNGVIAMVFLAFVAADVWLRR